MKTLPILCGVLTSSSAHAQAWRDCIPNSIGPGGCDSIGPGGGQSIGPGGGQSIGPGGGRSIGPGGGQSIGPGGGLSIGPGGGLAIDRDRSRGLSAFTYFFGKDRTAVTFSGCAERANWWVPNISINPKSQCAQKTSYPVGTQGSGIHPMDRLCYRPARPHLMLDR